LVDLCLSISARCVYYSVIQTKATRPSLREAGFGRRVRGNANSANILGGILPEK